jgi:hypothetical protein
MLQLVFRLLFLMGDVGVNIYVLSTRQPFLMGADYIQSIVLFNAAMMMLIYIVDYGLVKLQRHDIVVHVGEKMIQ